MAYTYDELKKELDTIIFNQTKADVLDSIIVHNGIVFYPMVAKEESNE